MSETLTSPVNAALLRGCMPRIPQAEQWVEPFRRNCRIYGITTPWRLAAFIAQIGHESGDLTRLSESLDYTPERLLATYPTRVTKAQAEAFGRTPTRKADQRAIAELVYGRRMGNEFAGDAWTYRGAGAIQLTGWATHNAFAIAHDMHVTEVPDFLRTPDGAIASAAWFWNSRALNPLADRQMIDAISRKVNGGDNGLEDRRARYQRARAVLTL